MTYFEDNKLIVRSMKETDIEKLKIEYQVQGWPKDIEILKGYYRDQQENKKYIIVGELNKKVAGYVTLLKETKNGPFANKNIPELVDFIVFEKYQKHGLGNKILDVAENIASELSDTITLSVGLHYGYGSAHRVYIKRGYIPDGSGVWYKNKQLEQYSDTKNDDELVLFLSKNVRNNIGSD